MTRGQHSAGRAKLSVGIAAVLALMLTGYALSARIAAEEFDTKIVRAEMELKRLEYVLRLHEKVSSLRVELTRRGVESLPEPLHGEGDLNIWLFPSPPTPTFPGPAHLAHQSRYLDELHALIATGLIVEKTIPAFERRRVELERLLEAAGPDGG